MTDKEFEQKLKKVVEKCVKKEWDEVSSESKKIKYKTSKEFDEKMMELYKKEEHQKHFTKKEEKDATINTEREEDNRENENRNSFYKRKVKKKIALIAALVAVLLCGSVFAQEALQEWKSNLIVNHREDSVQIEYGGKEKEDTRESLKGEKQEENKQKKNEEKEKQSEEITDYSIPGKYKVRWVPRGYKKEDESTDDKNPYWYALTYSDKNGNLIIYNQHDADYVINMAFDKEKDIEEDISVCGVKGKYFIHEGIGTIIYEVKGVTYTIRGGVSKKELIKILESRVRIKE